MIPLEQILDSDLSKMNHKNFKRLKENVHRDSATFMLGAGVSIAAGLPDWNRLLAKMWARLVELDIVSENCPDADEYEINYQEARSKKRLMTSNQPSYREKVNTAMEGGYKHLFSGMNVLETAEYILNYIHNTLGLEKNSMEAQNMTGQILRSLVWDSMKVSGDVKKRITGMKTEAIGEISAILCQCLRSPKDTGIHSVVTYNYDDLLECCLKNNEGVAASDINIILSNTADKRPRNGKINIYHPHGFIPVFDPSIPTDSGNKIILTETSYYSMEQKAYCWENSIQAKEFLDSTCIFIGFSGQDYNFRRMLKNRDRGKQKTDGPHYIFFCLDALIEQLFGSHADRQLKEKRLDLLLKELELCPVGSPEKDTIKQKIFSIASNQYAYSSDDKKEKEDLLKALAIHPDYSYEWVQLYHLLYAQHTYWESYGLTPIWTTYTDLPRMIRELFEKI